MKATYCLWKISVFRGLTTCSVVKVYRHFGRHCCLLHLGRRIHIDAAKSTVWNVGALLPTAWRLIPEYGKDWMGDYGKGRWMERVMFRGRANGTSFVGLSGYAQRELLRGPFRIYTMGLTSCTFQDTRNGTYFVGLSGYGQWDLLRGPFRIYAMGLTSWAFQDMRNGTYFVNLSRYTEWDLLCGPFRICVMGLTSWTFQDMRNGTSFLDISGYTQRQLFPRSDCNKNTTDPSLHSKKKRERPANFDTKADNR